MSSGPEREGLTSRIVEVFLRGRLTVLLIVMSLLAGAFALLVTPREEDPQIVVPVADVLIAAPGVGAAEVDRQVASRLEKLLYEIDGVEYVYAMSRANQAVVTVRFYVGEDRERSLVKIYNKLSMHADRVPPQVTSWVVKPVEIDDVPIWAATLYGDDVEDDVLRRVGEEIESGLKAVPDTGRTAVIGGTPWKLMVQIDPQAAAAHGVGWGQVAAALAAANVRVPAGALSEGNVEAIVEAGAQLRGPQDLIGLVVAVQDGLPVYLGDLAHVSLGPGEPASYCRIAFGPADPHDASGAPSRAGSHDQAAVTVAVAKRKGANAVAVAEALTERLREIERDILPDGVRARVTRDYGETANHKVNELVEALWVAILIVIGLIAMTLGWREGVVVATAVPITFALTLLVNYLAGYTINRVTLFALILALGLVVDDPIVDVENIYRHLRRGGVDRFRAVLDAVNEVRPPIILATLAVIVSFLPMFFITGMMGPYMRPMALNVPLAMLMSLLVAFTVTPWISLHALKPSAQEGEEPPLPRTRMYRAYGALLRPLLRRRGLRWSLLLVTAALFGVSGWLAVDRRVPLKMLPFDNKNELQVLIDTPEGTTLESTEAAAAAVADYLCGVPEVTWLTTYAGVPGPIDFNGLVRHYYLRHGPTTAEVRVNFAPKGERVHQSHEIALRIRRDIERIAAQHEALVRIVELPPGPPVLSTVVAEVYGRPYTPYAALQEAAGVVAARLRAAPGVVDVDTTVEAEQSVLRFVPDREKARLSGVSEQQIAQTIAAATGGLVVGAAHVATDVNPAAIELRLAPEDRTRLDQLDAASVVSETAGAVQLSELGAWERTPYDRAIYRKNLRPVVYVTAEVAGRTPADVVLDVQADRGDPARDRVGVGAGPGRPLESRSFLDPGGGIAWSLPADVEVSFHGEGEWKITLDVFRDLGLAFAAACLGIYVLLVYETESYLMPLILMISIPLTVIGILPGFWLLNALGAGPIDGWANPTYFTATAMIGMIALSGIAVRNAILLIEFVHSAEREGHPLTEALIRSGAVRIRPIFLTAGTAMLAAWPITLDPIFSGLAWALIFGLFVSTTFTLVIIPVVYGMVYGRNGPAPVLVNRAAVA